MTSPLQSHPPLRTAPPCTRWATRPQAISTRRGRFRLPADSSADQAVMWPSGRVGSLTPADAPRLTFHPPNWWNGRQPAWVPVTDAAPTSGLRQRKHEIHLGRLSLGGLSPAFRRHWPVFTAKSGVCLGQPLNPHRAMRPCTATQWDYTGQLRYLTNTLLHLWRALSSRS